MRTAHKQIAPLSADAAPAATHQSTKAAEAIAKAERTAPSMTKAKPAILKVSAKPKATATRPTTKTNQTLALLRRPTGCTLAELMKTTKWQQHSVRGFLSGTVKKRLGLKLTSNSSDQGRRYKVTGTPRQK